METQDKVLEYQHPVFGLVKVVISNWGVEIYIADYGVANTERGKGPIVDLCLTQYNPVLYAYGDITQEEPTHRQNLGGAHEIFRDNANCLTF